MVTRVWIALAPNVLLLDMAVVAEPLRIANKFALAAGRSERWFDVKFVAPTAKTETSVELSLVGTHALPRKLSATNTSPDWVFIVGVSSTPNATVPSAQVDAANAKLVAWVRDVVAPALATQRARLLTICSGALIAAEAGLLDDKQCTTHHSLTDELRTRHPRCRVLENRIYVVDGTIATSAGVTAGLDLTLAAIAEHCGPVLASAVARELVVYWRRAGHDPQHSPLLAHRNHLHAAVHRAQDAVLAQPASDWTVETLAAKAFVSSRHLRRLFVENAQIAPLAYVQRVRVALAQERIQAFGVSAERAAEMVGFSSARHLRDAVRAVARVENQA